MYYIAVISRGITRVYPRATAIEVINRFEDSNIKFAFIDTRIPSRVVVVCHFAGSLCISWHYKVLFYEDPRAFTRVLLPLTFVTLFRPVTLNLHFLVNRVPHTCYSSLSFC